MQIRRRALKITRRQSTPGTTPGQVLPSPSASETRINVFGYGPDGCIEEPGLDLDSINEMRGKYPVLWIDVVGLGDADLIIAIGEIFGLHALALEDVVNTHQRPKVEEYDDHLFLIARMLDQLDGTQTDQTSMFLGRDFLITFQERSGDCFDPVRDRIRRAKGRMRQSGPDYLCHALLDAIVDFYFPALERYGDVLEDAEVRVIEQPHSGHVGELHAIKRDLLMLRRAIWPHREMINALIRDEHPLFAQETRPFLRDCYDHTVQLMDIVATYREIASGLIDIYISSTSARLNEVMKVLTIIATIFMPLSFIASLYGMNFDRQSPWNMPELGWPYGYLFALALMLASAGGFLWYFWRAGWLFERRK